mgnify:CR=1 FL=1
MRETLHHRGKQDRPSFIRKSRGGDEFEVIGKETDYYTCKECNKVLNQKFFHIAQNDNFGRARLKTTCQTCYNADRNIRRAMAQNLPPVPEFCEGKCGRKSSEHKLYNDHDKKTGKHRGWLCHNCNTGVGHFNDNLEGMNKMREYLIERT